MSYERLIHEHDRIDRALARLQRLSDMAEPDISMTSETLSELATELTDHLAREDGTIYPRMIESRVGEVSSIARRFIAEFDAIAADWKRYLDEWMPDRMGADWDRFRRETDAMIARLTARIHAENTVLYSAALNHGLIALRAR